MWVEAAKAWCDKYEFKFLFRPGVEIFEEVFKDVNQFFIPFNDSLTGNAFLDDYEDYNSLFGRVSVTCSHSKSYNKGQVFEVLPNVLAYVNNGSQTWSFELAEQLRKFEYVIVDEPFPFIIEEDVEIVDLLVITDKLRKLLEESKYEKAIAIHVRQGDYSRWQNGKYYKDDVFYNDLIQAIAEFKEESKISKLYVVHNGEFCLNEMLYGVVDEVSEADTYSPHIKDIIAIASSNIVIGPYSTYSKFASALRKIATGEETKLLFFDTNSVVSDLKLRIKELLDC